jgi:DNA replication protein DnaC
MLMQPTLDKLTDMRLTGLRRALEDQLASPQYADLSFEERIGLLVDQEWTRRQDTRLRRRLEHANFRHRATIEDLEITVARGLDRRQVLQLAGGEWIRQRLNCIVSGPTGVGKTYLACALGRSACKAGFVVRYERLSSLLHRIRQAQGEGSWPELLRGLARIQLLVIDDWLRDPVTASQARDLAEILDDRYQSASTLLATQVPVADWHGRLGDQDAADGILDRIIHNSYRIDMKGESQRKLRSPLGYPATPESPA